MVVEITKDRKAGPGIILRFLRSGALAGAAIAVGAVPLATNACATGIANSGIWGYSPIVFVPLENGSTQYSYYIGGSTSTAFGGGLANTPTLTSSLAHGLSNTEILGGFLFGSSFSNAGTGGDAAVATGSSLAVAAGAKIIGDAAYTGSSSGSGFQNALASLTGVSGEAAADGEAEALANILGTAFIQGSLTLTSAVSSVSPGAPLRFFEGYQQSSLNQYLFSLPDPGISMFPPVPNIPPLAVFAGASGSISVNTEISGDSFDLSSGAPSAPLAALLLSSQSGSTNVVFDLGGNNGSFSTTGDASGLFHMLASANQEAVLDFSVGGDNVSFATTGQQSNGISWSSVSTGESRIGFQFAGDNISLATSGDQSLGLISQVSSISGNAFQNFTVSGNNAGFSTTGENASAIVFATNSQSLSQNQWAVSGSNISVNTAGTNSTAMTGIANGTGVNKNTVSFSGDNFSVETNGEASAGLLIAAVGGNVASNSVSVSGANSRITTSGQGSVGIAVLGSGTELVSGNTSFSGAGSGISTLGNGAIGLSSIGVGQSVRLTAELSGAGASITTLGNHSAGVVLTAFGEEEGITSFSMSGEAGLVSTAGEYANGVYLAAAGASSSMSALLINGAGSRIETQGNYSSGVTFAGHIAEMEIGVAGGAIETFGINAHAVFLENYLAALTISGNGNIRTNSAESDGIFFQRFDGQTTITNRGTIEGFRNGINILGELGLANFGVISAASESGVRFDHGNIVNYGLITGPSGITALQAADQPVSVFTPGAILSSNGPTGVALSFLGIGEDELIIAPWTSLSGTIDLGGGIDQLIALSGVNADLEVLTPVETVSARTGIVSIIEAGNRIVIVDQSLFLASDVMAAESVNQFVTFDTFFGQDGVSSLSGSMAEQAAYSIPKTTAMCDPQLGLKAGYSELRRGQQVGISSINLAATGAIGFLTYSNCLPNPFSLFGGFQSGNVSAGAGQADYESLFGGFATSMELENDITMSALLGFGYTRSDYQRRIINNRLAAGFEWGNSNSDSLFAFGKIELTGQSLIGPYEIKPFVSTEFALGRKEAFDETNSTSGLSFGTGDYDYLKAVAGLRVPIFNGQFAGQDNNSDLDFSVQSKIGLSYATSRSNGTMSIAGQPLAKAGLNLEDTGLFLGLDFQLADPEKRIVSSLNATAEFGENNFYRTQISGKILIKF